jgi:hypothetical protein
VLHIEKLVCTKEKKILSSSEFLDVVKNMKDLAMNPWTHVPCSQNTNTKFRVNELEL